jgi:aspartate carbamoyltransferase catalytic subunit
LAEKRDFISIDDFSNEEIEILFVIADKMNLLLHRSHGVLAGHLMGSMFLEPSTRTRLSFEAAMNRLGGRVITMSDVAASSFSKGETLADSVRIVSSYTDILVLRHPVAGAARLAADYAPVPVINAGDGGHEHPTQTLCDLYALRQTKGRLEGLKVIIYGDLKYGRTTHSLALALARFGTDVLCIAEPGLELPKYVRDRMATVEQTLEREIVVEDDNSVFSGDKREALLYSQDPDAWPIADGNLQLAKVKFDAIYVTRLQRERMLTEDGDCGSALPPIDARFLSHRAFEDAVVLHPLPRVDEIDHEIDGDPRSYYFKQAALGVPVRMALISFLLGHEMMRVEPAPRRAEQIEEKVRCANKGCVIETEGNYLVQKVWVASDGTAHCVFCDEIMP